MPGRRATKPGAPPDARDLFVREGLSLEDLAAKHRGARGWSLSNLTKRCGTEEWVRLREEFCRNAAAKADERAAGTEAAYRAKQLGRFRKIEAACEAALAQLLPRLKKGQRLLGDKQGNLSGVTELTRTLALARESITKLVDTRDDRFTELMEAASRMAEGRIDEVEDFNTDDEVLEAMTPKIPVGLEYLRFKLGTGAADTGETPPPAAVNPAERKTGS